MALLTAFLVLAIGLITAILIFGAISWQKRYPVQLRPLHAYRALSEQIGRTVESGQHVHVTLGRGGLHQTSNPVSLSALIVLDYLAKKSTASTTPPYVTVGEGTLLMAAQDSVQQAYHRSSQSKEVNAGTAQLLAPEKYPFVLAGGVNNLIHQQNIGSNILLGHLGAEISLMAEAASRQQIPQLIGTDNVEGLAVARAITSDSLIGEEFLAAGAYLQGQPVQLASLQVQDLLRWVAVAGILLSGLIGLLIG